MRRNTGSSSKVLKGCLFAFFLLFTLAFQANVEAFTLRVVDPSGNPITGGFHWLAEEDTTYVVTPGVLVSDSLSVNIFRSYASLPEKLFPDINHL